MGSSSSRTWASPRDGESSNVLLLYTGQGRKRVRLAVPRDVTLVRVDPSVKIIDAAAFSGRNRLVEVDLGERVEEIGRDAFDGCESLRRIKIPSFVKTIGPSAFRNCGALSDVELCEGIERIEARAFENCATLKLIKIPSTVRGIGNYAFGYCDQLVRVDFCKGFNGDIAEHAFYNCASLDYISIPATVESVGTRVFHGFDRLMDVNLREGLEEIKDGAFSDCVSLERVQIPPTIKTIGVESFRDCHRLVEVKLWEGLERISHGAFLGCSSLKRIKIPSTVREIPEYGFTYCKQLEEVEIDEGVEIINMLAFRNCRLLRSILLPSTVKMIGDEAFAGCDRLEKAVLNEGLEEIRNRAFSDCRSLTFVKIPSTVKVVDTGTFRFCEQLHEVVLCEGVEQIKCHAFHHCKSLKGIKTPSTVKVVGKQAFHKCKQLKEVELHEGLKRIEFGAFSDCKSLKCAKIPSTVKVIPAEAFLNCKQLVSVKLCSRSTKIGPSSFAYCSSLRNLLVSSMAPSMCCFEGCNDLVKLFGSSEMINNSLWDRFVSLPIHRICYYQSHLPPKMAFDQLDNSIDGPLPEQNGLLPNTFNIAKEKCQDCLGMTPLHILACSTKQNQDLCQFVIDSHPESLITEDKWGCAPILYALWCDAPQPIIQLLITSQKSLFRSHHLNWDKMVETLCRNEASLDIVKAVLEIKQIFFADHSINWPKAAQELTIHSLVTCVPFEDHLSASWRPMMETFSKSQALSEIVLSLLEIQQKFFSDPTDTKWQMVCEELVSPLEGWWQSGRQGGLGQPGLSISMELFCFLVRNNVADRLNSIGVKKWRMDIIDLVNQLSSVSGGSQSLKKHFNYIQSELAEYEHMYHQLKDATSLLELAIWKSNINQNGRLEHHTIDKRAQFRINCGVAVIVPNVLPFVKYWNVASQGVKMRVHR